MRHHGTGIKHFRHEVVVDLDLTYEVLALVAEPGLTVAVHTRRTCLGVERGAPPSRVLGRISTHDAR